MDLYELFFIGDGGGSSPTLITKNISANGVYLASDDNVDGYSKVTVATPTDTPALYAPSISRSGDTINISNPSTNGSFVTKYKVYNGNTLLQEQTATSFTLSSLATGDYALTVVACGTDFTDSPKSNVINASVYTITRTLENLTANNNTTLIGDNQTYNVTLTPASGYYLPEDITVTMGGVATTAYTYDSYTGAISIAAVSGNIVITASALSTPKLRRPILSLSGTTLTIQPPLYSETTNLYIDGNVEQTYTGTSAQVYDLSTLTTYGIYTIGVQSEATGYTNSDLVAIQYTVGATISITGNTLTLVDVISGVDSYDIYVDDVLVGDEPASSTIDLSVYSSSVQDGKHYVTVNAIGTGIADNRSNPAIWFTGVAPIYGVSGMYASEPALTRTDDAVNMSFVINSSTGAVESDFNDVFPWSEAEIVNDTAGKFIKMPEMYFRVGTDSSNRITDIAVSSIPSGSGNWYRVAPFMYGCYGASVSDNKMRSVSGVERSNYSRANYRTRAFANGDGYLPIDLYHRNVLMLLWWIEFATKKSDSIMSGRISGSGTAGGATRRPCGGTDSVPTPSGFEPTYGQMRYHYIEDFVGNVWEMVDGIYMNAVGQYDYVTANPANFSETTDGKSPLPFVNPSNNEISAYGWDPDNPFLFMPSDTVSNGSNNTYFCDAVSHSAGNPVMLAGAGYNNANANNGLSGMYCAYASYSNAYCGSRLLKIS